MRATRQGANFMVVLIGLVIIFQTNIKGVVASIFSTIQKNAGSIR
ncbi:MAG: Flp1 family type IVb pilin [Anaerobutyricum hallii]